jgi:hypothetical protein
VSYILPRPIATKKSELKYKKGRKFRSNAFSTWNFLSINENASIHHVGSVLGSAINDCAS